MSEESNKLSDETNKNYLNSRKAVIFKDLTSVQDTVSKGKFKKASALAYLRTVEARERDFSALQNDILRHNSECKEKAHLLSTKDFDTFSSLIFAINQACYDVIEEVPTIVAPSPTVTAVIPKKQLPKLTVEPFDGSIQNYSAFIELYNEIIHNNAALTDIEKFTYLRSFTKGEALALVSGFPLLPGNYADAYKSLDDRYSNSRRLGSYYAQKLFKGGEVKEIIGFLTTHRTAVSSLKSLPVTDLTDYLFFELCYNNCQASWRKSFEMEYSGSGFPKLAELFDHLQKLARMDELKIDFKPEYAKPKPFQKPKTLVTSSTKSNNSSKRSNNSSGSKCFHCSDFHSIYACPIFCKLPVADKRASVQSNHHCLNCLAKHEIQDCGSEARCRICQGHHHTYLHIDGATSVVPAVAPAAAATTNQPKAALACSQTQNNVLLGTVTVNFLDIYGQCHVARGVLDSASESNFVTLQLARSLGLKLYQDRSQHMGIGEAKAATHGSATVKFKSILNDSFKYTCGVSVISKICSDLPSCTVNADIAEKFKNLTLADPFFYRKGNIDFLLGVKAYSDLLSVETPNILQGSPMACRTKLGWVLFGSVPPSNNSNNPAISLLVQEPCLESILTKFFEVEEVQKHPEVLSPEEALCVEIFQKSKARDPDGRYVVPLLVNPTLDVVLSNRSSTIASHKNLEKRISKNSQLKVAYHAFMDGYFQENHMRGLEQDETPSEYLLPQHCVHKETSSTTKVRVVFNASQKGTNGISLNDCLMAGPKVQPDLIQVLIKFRLPKIALVTDVKMLYRQIRIQENDTKYLRTLYRADSNDLLQEMVHLRVVYGLKSSSYLAQAVLCDLAMREVDSYPLAAAAIQHSTVMDDICTGADSIEEARDLRDQLTSLLSLGCFQLRKWVSSHPDVLTGLPQAELEVPLLFDDGDPVFKILGLLWLPKEDAFSFKVLKFNGPATKRAILGYLARIFDPLGLIGPCVFYAKKIIQQTWLLGLTWDETIPTSLLGQWQGFLTHIQELSRLRIPRCLYSSSGEVYLVGFSDGSNSGYGACLYVVVRSGHSIDSQLLTSKSKLAPLKNIQTIPRLELLGMHLLAKLLQYVIQTTPSFAQIKIHLFTDSQIVLAWLRTPPHSLQTFVANRIVAINNITKNSNVEFRFVSTDLNSADVLSRGCTASELVSHPLWWAGPQFIRQPIEEWPSTAFQAPEEIPELKKTVLVSPQKAVSNPLAEDILRFSSFSRLLHTFAWIHRWQYNVRNKLSKVKGSLTTKEIDRALINLVRITQEDAGFNANSKNLLKLAPFLDRDGVLRVGGRLRHSSISEDSKHPVLLPKSSHLARLVCDYYHKILLHAGPRTTQYIIQRRFWILSAHSLVRQRIHQCVTCHRFSSKPATPFMADLPPSRVCPSFAFKSVSTDFAGPFSVKESRIRKSIVHKSYFVIFVCHYSKAVHLEPVSELSTEAFIASFSRFVSRRGLCSDVYSDQGRNYIGAERQLRECSDFLKENSEVIFTAAASLGIQWHFVPPYSPNFNGLAEANVKQTKRILYRQLKNEVPTWEAFATILCRVEAVLNSRPIGCLSSSPLDSVDVLTPGHLLIGRPLVSVPEKLIPEDTSVRSQWQLIQKISQAFWKQFVKEYVHTQIQRQRWTRFTSPPKVGEVVYLYGIDCSALNYPLGRIVSVRPSPDGVIRVCTVRTSDGKVYTRPVNRLVALPSV